MWGGGIELPDDFNDAADIISSNPNATREDMYLEITKNTDLNDTQINALLDTTGIREGFTNEDLSDAATSLFSDYKGLFSSRKTEKENMINDLKSTDEITLTVDGIDTVLTPKEKERFINIVSNTDF